MFEYDTWRVIWWALLGLLLIGFAVMAGFDLGFAALLRILARDEAERHALLETVEPVWEGNQVWFILGGGAIFAAWPPLYAASFSGFYLAMLLVLLSLILRPVGFSARGKIDDARWRALWDAALIAGGIVPALVFGVAFANLFVGVPFTLDQSLRLSYSGGLIDLLSPHALLVGVVSLAMLSMHGCVWAANKTEAALAARARRIGPWLALVFVLTLGLAAAWTIFALPAYRIVSPLLPGGPSNPLFKQVALDGNWLDNFRAWPWMWLAPALAYGGGLGVFVCLRGARDRGAFACSALAIAGTILSAGFALFPFLLPSSTDP